MNDSPIKLISEKLNISTNESEKIIEKVIEGGEIKDDTEILDWINYRLTKNTVFIDEDGYAKMCVDALKILTTTAATDYGSSRQRDLGQLWADMTRGYLGEYAFKEFLKNNWKISANLGHDVGEMNDYLPMDIHSITDINGVDRVPKMKISIKTTKWNGIWLDIPGDQFNHSDVHILVKVGAGRDHLFAFFKMISVFKDKVLKRGIDVGSLTHQESDLLYDNLPTFKPVPAYICGFVIKNHEYKNLSYVGKKGRINYKIQSWNGPIYPGDLERIKEKEEISGKIEFTGIGKFAHDRGYLFNTGNLLWSEKDWQKILKKL